MLKNIELFDKLVSRFHGRILFLKDIIGEDICVWSFFGNKRKLSEICCTSIVYATEKKQTKGVGYILNHYLLWIRATKPINGKLRYDNLDKLNFQKREYMKKHWIHCFMKEIVLNCPDKTIKLIVSPAELIIFNDIKNRRAWWWQAPSNKANPYWWKLVSTKPKSG